MDKKKVVFLDRDGVINVDKKYIYKIKDFEFVDEVVDVLLYLQSLGYIFFIVTNQSGIGRGYFSLDDYKIFTKFMLDQLDKNGIKIQQVEFCPHTPQEKCECRKPNIKMIHNIQKNFQIDFEKSWFFGDKMSDMKCASNANIKNKILISDAKIDDVDSKIFVIPKITVRYIKNIIKE